MIFVIRNLLNEIFQARVPLLHLAIVQRSFRILPQTLAVGLLALKSLEMSLDKWIEEQMAGSRKVVKVDDFSVPLKLIGGLDISLLIKATAWRNLKRLEPSSYSDYDTLELVYSDCMKWKTKIRTFWIPWIQGRTVCWASFERLGSKAPELIPQVLLVDGCGIYHPRGFGSASQIGLKLNVPTIGISKSFLKIDELKKKTSFSATLQARWNCRNFKLWASGDSSLQWHLEASSMLRINRSSNFPPIIVEIAKNVHQRKYQNRSDKPIWFPWIHS